MDVNRLQFLLLIITIIVISLKDNVVSSSEDFLLDLGGSDSSEQGNNISKILNSFFSSGYDKRVRPNYGGAPVEVGITMFIISISTVSEVKMDFTTDYYFRQAWQDPRLSFTPLPDIENLYVGAEVAEKIWVPDTFFANEKSAYFHKATTPNTFLRIGHKGDVFRSIRLTVTASCPMDLQYFPMDSQLCSIEIESYGYSMADIKYKWDKGLKSVGLSDSLSLPQFRVVGHRQQDKIIDLSTGNYSRLVCQIQFSRSLGFYLIQIYIPASLIVVISWVSFWLHRNATPARVALGVTTVLTMTTLISSTNAQLPKISYIKSIDVYLGTCFVMVFASLLEYATVGYLGKRIAMRKSRCQQLAKLAEQHRQKCSAAAAAAAVILQKNSQGSFSQTAPNTPMIQRSHTPMILSSTSGQRSAHDQPNVQIYFKPTTTSSVYHATGGGGAPSSSQFKTFPVTPTTMVFPTRPMSAAAVIAHPEASSQQQQQLQQQQRQGSSSDAPSQSQPPPPEADQHPPPPFLPLFNKNLNKMLGVSSSDIDKYSRVVFPVCFVCFNLMYWIIYMHISDKVVDDLVLLPAN